MGGGYSTSTAIITANDTYYLTITGTTTSPYTITNSAQVSVTVYSSGGSINCASCGGGGPSLAYGTLITMANGTKVPVQNLALGD